MAKKKIPENTGVHFELIHTKPRAFIMKDNSRVDFSLGLPFNSLELYKDGFYYLGLKEGAEVLFKDISEDELINLIHRARRKEDVLVLAKVSDSVSVKAAVKSKLESLSIS